MDLKQICDYIHNYFEKEEVEGEFTITDGSLVTTSLDVLENQYLMIRGSTFNDGIYQHPTSGLTDETFKGAIVLMAVPKDVLDVLKKASDWEEENAGVINSPFQSESFGGYSYSKGSSSHKDGSSGQLTWRDVFGNELKAYRKIG